MAALILASVVVGEIQIAKDVSHGAFLVMAGLLRYFALGLFVAKVVRYNLLAYFLGLAFFSNIPGGIRLMASGVTWYDINGIAVIALGAVPLLVGSYQVLRSSPEPVQTKP